MYKLGSNAFYYPEGQKIGIFFLLWGAYVGLILFRALGHGRSPYNHFDNSHSIILMIFQLIYVALNAFAFQLAKGPQKFNSNNYLYNAVWLRMLPFFIFGLWGTYFLPAAT